MRYAAKTVGKLAQISGTFSAEYADFEMKKAIEWLGGDRVEGKRHAAVSVVFLDQWIFNCCGFTMLKVKKKET